MKKLFSSIAAVLLGGAGMASMAPALAGERINWSISVGSTGYPPPVVYYTPRVVHPPAVVYYEPVYRHGPYYHVHPPVRRHHYRHGHWHDHHRHERRGHEHRRHSHYGY